MGILYPLLAVLGESFGKIIDKINFRKNKTKPSQMMILVFIGMLISLAVLLVITREPFPAMDIMGIILILVMIGLSFGQNIFDFMGIKEKDISFREPIANFKPIMSAFIASLFFSSERDPKIILAIIVGAAILYAASNGKKSFLGNKKRVTLDKGTAFLITSMLLSSILASVYKIGLEIFSPTYLYLFRVAGILFISLVFAKKKDLKDITTSKTGYGIFSGIVYFIGFAARLFSIKSLGLNYTILFLLAGTALRYLLSGLILREKIPLRKIVASAALLLIVIIAVYL